MSIITVRGLDEQVVRLLKLRAAQEGRSMEAEVRSILTAAVAADGDQEGFGTFLTVTFAGLGELELPRRDDIAAPVELG